MAEPVQGDGSKEANPTVIAKLTQNGNEQLLTKKVLIETIEKFNRKWTQVDLTQVTPVIPQENLVVSAGKESKPAAEAGKIRGEQGEFS